MSDTNLAIPPHQVSRAVCLARTAAVVSEDDDACEGLSNMTIHEPATLATLPPEIVLAILGFMDEKKDWLALARICRRLSNTVVPELDKYDALRGKYYAIWYACVAGNPDILLRRIAQDATVVNRYFTRSFRHERVDFRFGRGMTPLAVAIVAGRDNIVQLLLTNGADANRPDHCPVLRNTVLWYPINWAVVSKHESSVPIINMLKAHSADMDQVPKDFSEGVPEYPRGMKCAPIFRLLMLEKPRRWHDRPTSCEDFNHDLRRIQDLRLRQLTALLQSGANPNIRYDWDLVTPIFFLLTNLSTYTPSFYFNDRLILSHEGDAQADLVNNMVISFLDVLRDFGADISRLGNIYFYKQPAARRISAAYPETPLHAACRLNDRHKPVINWFLRNGLPINSLGEAQSTPLMAYCGSKFADMSQFHEFLNGGVMINHQDILGRTALHDICANAQLPAIVKEKVVRMMLNMGADPTILDHEGRVPAEEINSRNGEEGVLKMMQEVSEEWGEWGEWGEWEVRHQQQEKRENLNKGRRVVTEPLPRNKGNRVNHKSGRGDRASVDKNVQKEVTEGNHGGEHVDNQAVNSIGLPGQSPSTVSRGGRVNRGYRHNHRGANRYPLGDGNRNRSTDRSNSRKGIFPASCKKDSHTEHSWAPPPGSFYSNIRGGRYCSGGQRNDPAVDRGNDQDRQGNSKKNADDHCRGNRRNRGGFRQHWIDIRGIKQVGIQENIK
ncbi:ankyrin repeat-containing domain protein [Nemania sp. NC0429]|nr:ankyrin repeat-containing domain protein [Nemania sp. NC0429]